MPRVSDEHLAARRRQILDAARSCFSANGFHATSMQDVLAASGLSAGAVYRYFPSKEELIAAIAEEAIGELRAVFADSADDAPIAELLGRAIATVDRRARIDGLGQLAFQVWAEATRSPALGARIREAVGEARSALAARIARTHGSAVDADAVAAVVIAQLPAYLHARVVAGTTDADGYRRGLDGLLTVMR